MRRRWFWLVVCLTLIGCELSAERPPRPSAWVSQQGLTARERFDAPDPRWEVFTLPGDQALFQVREGALYGAVIPNRGYIWSLSQDYYRNVTIELTVQQTRGGSSSGFGLMCRTDADGNGYYFVISGDGRFAILKATPAAADPQPLVPWQAHPALRTDGSPNRLRVHCVNDYLALWANDRFLADVRDADYRLGQLGLVVGAVGETAWVRFDDLLVYDAALAPG